MKRERQVGEVQSFVDNVYIYICIVCLYFYQSCCVYTTDIFFYMCFAYLAYSDLHLVPLVSFLISVICCQTVSFWDHDVHLLWSVCNETRPTAYPLSWVLHARPCWRSQSCVPGPCWWAPQWSTLCVGGTQAPAPVFLRSRALSRRCRTALVVDVGERIRGECQRYMQSTIESALLTLCLHTHYDEEFN